MEESGELLVIDAALKLGVSKTRIRVLLRAGRLRGRKLGPREWRVSWPPVITYGKRGPSLENGSGQWLKRKSYLYLVR